MCREGGSITGLLGPELLAPALELTALFVPGTGGNGADVMEFEPGPLLFAGGVNAGRGGAAERAALVAALTADDASDPVVGDDPALGAAATLGEMGAATAGAGAGTGEGTAIRGPGPPPCGTLTTGTRGVGAAAGTDGGGTMLPIVLLTSGPRVSTLGGAIAIGGGVTSTGGGTTGAATGGGVTGATTGGATTGATTGGATGTTTGGVTGTTGVGMCT